MKVISLLTMFTFFAASTIAVGPDKRRELSEIKKVQADYLVGKKVVMVSHPNCGFCKTAFQEFLPEARSYLLKHGVFIAPIISEHYEAHVPPVLKWNKSSPFQHHMVLSTAKLASVELTSTPRFYFFHNGTLIDQFTGWPKDGSHIQRLSNAIDKLAEL